MKRLKLSLNFDMNDTVMIVTSLNFSGGDSCCKNMHCDVRCSKYTIVENTYDNAIDGVCVCKYYDKLPDSFPNNRGFTNCCKWLDDRGFCRNVDVHIEQLQNIKDNIEEKISLDLLHKVVTRKTSFDDMLYKAESIK